MRFDRILTFGLLVASATSVSAEGRLLRVLKADQTAFGTFVREKTPEEARQFGANAGLDFLFYDMERGAFDVPTLKAFLSALRATPNPHSVIVRIPPIHDDPEAARGQLLGG